MRARTADLLVCKGLDLIHRLMSDFALHSLGRALSARGTQFCQGRELRSRRRSRCSASLTESIRSPNLPPRDEWQVAISPDNARSQIPTFTDKGTDNRIRWSFGLQCELG